MTKIGRGWGVPVIGLKPNFFSNLTTKPIEQKNNLLLASSDDNSSEGGGWSSLMDKVRGRGWKSKSWGETDQGELVLEEQEISVTSEGGHSMKRKSSSGSTRPRPIR